MGDKTSIEWTDATWNPVTGCSKVSQGCKNCYAERVFSRAYGKERKFTDVKCHPERLGQPLRWKKPRRIFVNSMSDLFHESVPVEFIDRVFVVMAQAPLHTFQILTKRPERMRDYSRVLVSLCPKRRSLRMRDSMYKGHPAETLVCGTKPAHIGKFPWPLHNLHLGVSIEDQQTADERIPLLLQTPAAVRFVSAEPLLGPIDLKLSTQSSGLSTQIDWVIAGGESGPNARPMHPDWARGLRDQCRMVGVPFFFKQWGEWLHESEFRAGLAEVGRASKRMEAGDGLQFIRVGKKAAGNVLDGMRYREFPS